MESSAQAQPPESPPQLPRPGWIGAMKRAFTEFRADGMTDWAAALTYYGIQAIFPALLALVSILGLIGHSATQSLINNLNAVAPGPARQIFTSAIENLQRSRGAAGVLFIVGIATALWSASGYIAAFMRASNRVWDVEEGRPFYKTVPVRLSVTLVLVVLIAISSVAVVLTGGLAKQVGNTLGVGSSAVTAWDIAKWPVLVVLVALMLAILYYASPNVRQPGFKWVTPGGLVAVVLWIVASALFALYVANFAHYNKTYGSLGGIIVFLIWLWLSNAVILFGAEMNAELARARAIEGGQDPGKEPFLEPRQAATD